MVRIRLPSAVPGSHETPAATGPLLPGKLTQTDFPGLPRGETRGGGQTGS